MRENKVIENMRILGKHNLLTKQVEINNSVTAMGNLSTILLNIMDQ